MFQKPEGKLSWHEQEGFDGSKTLRVCANSLSNIVRFSIRLYKPGGVENLGGMYLDATFVDVGLNMGTEITPNHSDNVSHINGNRVGGFNPSEQY